MDKDTRSLVGAIVIFVCVMIGLSYGGWRLKRVINWKFAYGPKIEALETRISALEGFHSNDLHSVESVIE